MTYPVTPWTATVQSDIEGPPLYEIEWHGHDMQLFNTGDSLWWVVKMPDNGRMAFRLAYGMNSLFEKATVNAVTDGLLITAVTRLGSYRTVISLLKDSPAIFRYTTTFQADTPLHIPYCPRDIVPLTLKGRTENTAGTIYTHQAGSRAGHLFFSTISPKKNTVFYFQNLTALSEYCEDTRTSIAETVGGTWPEIGFHLPLPTQVPLPAKKEYCISDAFVLLTQKIPEDEFEIAEQFLEYLACTYLLLPLPETHYNDWLDISKKSLHDLRMNKGAWMYAGGHAYLNAYLCDYRTPPEIMVQLAVLYAIWEYDQWSGMDLDVVQEIMDGLPAFYDEKLKVLSRWLPGLWHELDNSEEQKAPLTMDSWYLHHPLMNLAKLALEGNGEAKELLLKSIEYPIKVAHHFDYSWPVFYKMDTLEVLKEETVPGMGGEKDVAGAYAHLMLLAYELTKEGRFLREAERAARKLKGLGLSIFYQANNTAFSALALLRLYKETGDMLYLKLSYLCLAGIFKNVQLSESNYGHSKHFPTFFGVFPLNDAPYRAAYEELEVYAALNDYSKEAEEMEAPIPDSLKLLLSEFVRYSIHRLPYFYPPNLPRDILTGEVKTGELDPSLWFPIEDLYDGWEKNGQVGQEVYGAGVGFGVVPRQFIKIEGEEMLLFTDYPIINFKKTKNSVAFHTLGHPAMQCRIRIVGAKARQYSIETKVGRSYKTVHKSVSPAEEGVNIAGRSRVRVKW